MKLNPAIINLIPKDPQIRRIRISVQKEKVLLILFDCLVNNEKKEKPIVPQYPILNFPVRISFKAAIAKSIKKTPM